MESHVTPDGGATFFVAAREPGHEESDLPTWASAGSGSVHFDSNPDKTVTCQNVVDVPGAFQLLNVLSNQECDRFVEISEALGYHGDAPVSLPRSIRHNYNVNWIVDDSIDRVIWDRCHEHFGPSSFDHQQPVGINARFRFYRYTEGDYFSPHTDGAWPGSRVIDGRVVADAYGDRFSQMSFLIFLSDGYEGGRTLFQTGPHVVATIHTPKGAVLCFPHGMHPQHCVHAGEEIISGQKYIIRTDVLYG